MILASHGIIGSQIQSFVGLLDLYPSAAAAYSLRKLSGTYSGSAIRVRRSSDNTEQNIGFTSTGNLDTSALTTFCGSGDGFVTTWYDQSGNSRNSTQTTAANQPQIVSSGTILTLNSKPTLNFDGTNDKLLFNLQWANSTFDFFGISKTTKIGYQSIFAEGNGSNGYLGLALSNTSSKFAVFNTGLVDYTFGQSYSINTQYLINYYSNGIIIGSSNSVTLRINNSTAATTNGIVISNTNSNSLIGAAGTGDYLSGNIQEIILYPSDKTSIRTNIATNINSYYGIY